MKFHEVNLTPAMAKEWLANANENRNVRRVTVRAYAEMMRQGLWEQNGDPFRFDAKGRMTDGQHRAHAVVESGVTIRVLVIEGVSDASMLTVDTGSRRMLHDVLTMRGELQTMRLASIVNLTYAYTHGTIGETTVVSLRAALAFFNEDPGGFREATRESNNVYNYTGLGVPSAIGAACYLFAKADRDSATRFWHAFTYLDSIPLSDPVHVVRRALENRAKAPSSRAGRTDRFWCLAVLIKAFNAWRLGHPMSGIRWSGVGKMAEPFPEILPASVTEYPAPEEGLGL